MLQLYHMKSYFIKHVGGNPAIAKLRPYSGLIISSIFFLVLIIVAAFHGSEFKKLLLLLQNANIGWMVIAILLQIPTYVFTGAVWHLAVRTADYNLTLKSLSELAVEQLTVNQMIPTGGVAGNVIVVKAMKRLGLPTPIAMEVFFIETLSNYISLSVVTFLSVVILWWYHNITPIIVSLISIFFVVEVVIVCLIWAAFNHQRLYLPTWIKKRTLIARMLSAMENVSGKRVFSIELLIQAGLLRIGVFFLDALTIFAIMRSLGIESSLIISFVALVIATVAGTITLLPGGVGGFEAGSIGILNLLGIPLEAAIATIIIFRVLSLWIPLIPGTILAKKDLNIL